MPARIFGLIQLLTFLSIGATLPADAGAQAPGYCAQWGSGVGPWGPNDLDIGVLGRVYVADAAFRVQVFDSAGAFLFTWGSLGTGNGGFYDAHSVAVNGNGRVYVSDGLQERIQAFTSAGDYLFQWGSPGSGNGQFNSLGSLAVGPDGKVYVADRNNFRIQVFDGNGSYVTQWGSYAVAVAVSSSGQVYVVDSFNQRIVVYDSNGSYIDDWGSPGTGNGQFNQATSVALDGNGNVYVADALNHRIQMFDGVGNYIAQWGSFGTGNGQFDTPIFVTADAVGNVYVTDSMNLRIQKFGCFASPAPVPAFGDGGLAAVILALFASGAAFIASRQRAQQNSGITFSPKVRIDSITSS
jgi:sugar lactone lactonase YvrE